MDPTMDTRPLWCTKQRSKGLVCFEIRTRLVSFLYPSSVTVTVHGRENTCDKNPSFGTLSSFLSLRIVHLRSPTSLHPISFSLHQFSLRADQLSMNLSRMYIYMCVSTHPRETRAHPYVHVHIIMYLRTTPFVHFLSRGTASKRELPNSQAILLRFFFLFSLSLFPVYKEYETNVITKKKKISLRLRRMRA